MRSPRSWGESNSLIGTALRLLTEQPDAVSDLAQDDDAGAGRGRLGQDVEGRSRRRGSISTSSFLAVYDNKLRKLTGSYYTPPEVVQAMVRLCDEALKSPGGSAWPRGWPRRSVHVADPAMGSGTYPARACCADCRGDRATSRARARSPAAMSGGAAAVRVRAAVRRVRGRAAAAVAEMIELRRGARPPRLFVTDTLGDPYDDEETGTGIDRQLSKSRVEANRIKREQPITVVIGNPPYKEKAKGEAAGWRTGRGNGTPILATGSRRQNGAPARMPSICATSMSISGAGRRGRCSSRARAGATASRR